MNEYRCRAIVNTDAAIRNFYVLRTCTPPNVKMLCVVKANAYGHGARQMAHLFEESGADMFAVATAEEALHLRTNGICTPILVLGYAPASYAWEFRDQNILPTIYSPDVANQWNRVAEKHGIIVPCHIKIDSGMHRIGYRKKDTFARNMAHLGALSYLYPTGIYTHLACADMGDVGKNITAQQLSVFLSAVEYAQQILNRPLLTHVSNTAATLYYPEATFDMVRVGLGLYGYGMPALKPVMQFETTVISVETVEKGDFIGYGATYLAQRDVQIATLSAGYADGIDRRLEQCHIPFYIQDVPCPIVGRICMDMCMVDVSCLPGRPQIGEPAVLFGGNIPQNAADVAESLQTIPYEVLTSVSGRVPRIYQ